MPTRKERPAVLILEDEAIVGLDIAMSLEEEGFSVLGPFRTVELALQAVATERPAFGLLDLNLGREVTSEDAAEYLTAVGCPFLFLTGYAGSPHPVTSRFPHAECISKPVDMGIIANKIRSSIH